ncbi:hypothetical protein D1872_326970 [compost metagenome]
MPVMSSPISSMWAAIMILPFPAPFFTAITLPRASVYTSSAWGFRRSMTTSLIQSSLPETLIVSASLLRVL